LTGTLANIGTEIEKLPQVHSDLWDVFKGIRNKYDESAYEELLADDSIRYSFYEKLSAYLRILKMALSSLAFENNTPESQIGKYKKDAAFFLALRVSVKRRFSDELNFKEYEPQVQKLIDKHITTEGEVLRITELVNIFDKQERQAELEKITGKAAKADHIASRTMKAISIKMNEDPVFYKKLSQLIRQTIEEYHHHRITEAEYLIRAQGFENQFFDQKRDHVPVLISDNPVAIAFYNLVTEELKQGLSTAKNSMDISAEIAADIDAVIQGRIIENGNLFIDWQKNDDIKGMMKIDIDDLIYDLQSRYDLKFDLDAIDLLIEECIKVAETRYKA